MNKRQIKKMMTIQFDKLPKLKVGEFYLLKFNKNKITVEPLCRFVDMFKKHTKSNIIVLPNEINIEIINKEQIKMLIKNLEELLEE